MNFKIALSLGGTLLAHMSATALSQACDDLVIATLISLGTTTSPVPRLLAIFKLLNGWEPAQPLFPGYWRDGVHGSLLYQCPLGEGACVGGAGAALCARGDLAAFPHSSRITPVPRPACAAGSSPL